MASAPSDILLNGLPTLDVRTPAEFAQGRAPGAQNCPLFSDEERKTVGIAYKREGRDIAVSKGLALVGPRLESLVEEAQALAPEKRLNLYCWRGGMRSGSMAWLLQTAGFEVNLIDGGYKAWRKEVMNLLATRWKFINLGGLTGVGKTDVLKELRLKGEQVLDLEALASHTGSAFNSHPGQQPSTEQFENYVAEQLLTMDIREPIWIEDESRNIGKVYLNEDLFHSKRDAPFVLINRSKEERVDAICKLYGTVPHVELKASFQKIERRIGGQFLKSALEYIDQKDLASAARIALRYYDKAYMHSMSKNDRKPIHSLNLTGQSASEAAESLIQWRKEIKLFD